ncbi:MAG TPA: helix-turn-helix domain-containing protein [Baekduia sp.]|nr:helix-turn-helix domain-containing protein [Baekduia sp.]
MTKPQTTLVPVEARPKGRADAGRADRVAAAGARVAEAAGALAGGRALAAVLGQVAGSAAEALAARRCAIYLRAAEGGDFVGAVGHEDGAVGGGAEWIAHARIPARTAGLPALLRHGAPGELRLPPAARGRRRSTVELRPSLVAPIRLGQECGGLLVVDWAAPDALSDPGAREVARAFAALAGAAVQASSPSEAVRRQLALLVRRLRLERQAGAAEDALLGADPATTEPAEVASLVARRLGLPCAVLVEPRAVVAFDATGAPAAASALLSAAARGEREVVAQLAGVEVGRARIVRAQPALGIPVRHVVGRLLDGPGDALIVVAEAGRALRETDVRVVQRAAGVLGLALRVQQRLVRAECGMREAVVRDAVLGHDTHTALRRRSGEVGLDLDAPNVVCLVGVRGGALGIGALRRAATVAGTVLADHAAPIDREVVLIAPLDPARPRHRAIAAVRDALTALVDALPPAGGEPFAVVSSACRRVDDLPHAVDECRELAAGFGVAGRPAAVRCADDLGAGRLLLGSVSAEAAERFVEDAFGSIGEGEDRAKLLETLEAFFAANGFVRATASALGVHENTVRLRFRRLAAATGLDVLGSTDDQLTARLALTLRHLSPTVPTTKEPA